MDNIYIAVKTVHVFDVDTASRYIKKLVIFMLGCSLGHWFIIKNSNLLIL